MGHSLVFQDSSTDNGNLYSHVLLFILQLLHTRCSHGFYCTFNLYYFCFHCKNSYEYFRLFTKNCFFCLTWVYLQRRILSSKCVLDSNHRTLSLAHFRVTCNVKGQLLFSCFSGFVPKCNTTMMDRSLCTVKCSEFKFSQTVLMLRTWMHFCLSSFNHKLSHFGMKVISFVCI